MSDSVDIIILTGKQRQLNSACDVFLESSRHKGLSTAGQDLGSFGRGRQCNDPRRSVLTDHRDVQECRRVLLGKSR